jgi:hypothetical protein
VNQGPGGVWCDVDVVEFSYFGAPEPVPKEQHYTEIVDDLRGGDPCIGSGSQVFFFALLFNVSYGNKSSGLQKNIFDLINIACM